MRSHRLIIKVLSLLAFTLASIMASLNIYPSWSQYARSLEEPLLLATLSSISTVFIIRSLTHPRRNDVLYRVLRPVRLKHINRCVGFFFIGVLCTPVTHPVWWIQTLHMAFTFLAISIAYSELTNYYKDTVSLVSAYLGLFIGAAGMIGGLWFHVWSVGIGEIMAATPILVHVLFTNRK